MDIIEIIKYVKLIGNFILIVYCLSIILTCGIQISRIDKEGNTIINSTDYYQLRHIKSLCEIKILIAILIIVCLNT